MPKPEGAFDFELQNESKIKQTAITYFKVIHEFNNFSLLRLRIKTGRRHQLRKHMSGIGNPILGDKDYGVENHILKGKGLYLHAHSLQFVHPFTNNDIYLKDELPERFKKLFNQLN